MHHDPGAPLDWAQETEGVRDKYRGLVQLFADGATEEEVHRLYCVAKESAGWSYAKSNDFDKKQSPNLTSYEKIALRLKLKYILFRNMVLAFTENTYE